MNLPVLQLWSIVTDICIPYEIIITYVTQETYTNTDQFLKKNNYIYTHHIHFILQLLSDVRWIEGTNWGMEDRVGYSTHFSLCFLLGIHVPEKQCAVRYVA